MPEALPVLSVCQSVYFALALTPNTLSKGHCSTGLETGCKPVLFSYLFSYLSLPLSLPHVRPLQTCTIKKTEIMLVAILYCVRGLLELTVCVQSTM